MDKWILEEQKRLYKEYKEKLAELKKVKMKKRQLDRYLPRDFFLFMFYTF